MFSSFAVRLPSINILSGPRPIDIPSIKIHETEEAPEKRARTLKHLIRGNHANHSIIYHHLQFHNHTPHILGSAFIFGATSQHLTEIYEKESESLEPWHDSPGEITKDDWRDYFGAREYQRAYIDFFEDQLVLYSYDWKKLTEHYLYEGKNPLINNMISGLAHSLIHLGYAYELSSRTIAIEALALGTCFYDFMHKYLDDPSYRKPAPYQYDSPLEILAKIAKDDRFDGLVDEVGTEDIQDLFDKREGAILEYWNAWDLTKPKEQFEQSQKTAVALLVATHDKDSKYDFFLVHLLTSSHAVRVLLPLVPAKFQLSLVLQWWLFTVAVYISQQRPSIDMGKIADYDLKGRDWKFVNDKALHSDHALDAHFVKALRSMHEAAQTWGDESQFYLKAAVKFGDEFRGWGGFGVMDVHA